MDSFLKSNAPAKGYILACYPDTLVFEPYILRDGEPIFEGSSVVSSSMIVIASSPVTIPTRRFSASVTGSARKPYFFMVLTASS